MLSKNSLIIPYLIFFSVALLERIIRTFFSKKINCHKVYRKLYQPLLYVLIASYIGIVIVSVIEFCIRRTLSPSIMVLGILLFSGGVYLRNRAISALNDDWSLAIKIRPGQQLITDGVYKKLSHPYHLSVLMELGGFSLISNAYIAMILVVFIQTPLILFRVFFEEKVLTRRFGDHYRIPKQTAVLIESNK